VTALAIVTTYQEADIIGWTVRHLRQQGCDVLVIDCQSTDSTRGVARAEGAAIQLFGAPPVSWHALLGAVEQATSAYSGEFEWFVHCDADEIRYSDMPGETLVQGFERVQSLGYNAIDHRVVTFHPTPESAEFDGLQDPEQYFRYYSPDPLNQRLGQVKAWRNVGPVSLASSGGHQVQFRGRRVYPMQWLSKHYPIRSQAHGERKVFQERKWLDQAQGRKDWHVQYQGIAPGHSFLKDPKLLLELEMSEEKQASFEGDEDKPF
jgi:glycosyltransferase involved in cell wall biosynthesis